MVENSGNFIYVEEFPNPLDIYRKNENEYFEASITLKNITNNYLIFKVYINKVDANQKSIYVPKPSTSFIKPNDYVKIKVNRYYNKAIEENNNSNNDKFLIKIHSIEKVVNSNDEAKEIIKNKIYDEKKEQNLFININVKNDYKKNLIDLKNSSLGNNFNIDTELDVSKLNDKSVIMNEINKLKQHIFNQESINKNMEEQLKNLENNKILMEKKNRVTTSNEKSFSNKKDDFNLLFIISFVMLSIVFGGYLSKIKNSFNKPNLK